MTQPKSSDDSYEICIWKEQEDGAYWSTSCGKAFSLEDGTPSHNKMKFCCYCGLPLVESILTKEIYEGFGFGV